MANRLTVAICFALATTLAVEVAPLHLLIVLGALTAVAVVAWSAERTRAAAAVPVRVLANPRRRGAASSSANTREVSQQVLLSRPRR